MTMITPSYLGETIEYSSLHACRSTLEDPTEETERPEGLEAGTLELVGHQRERIVHAAHRLLTSSAHYASMSRAANPYGDGLAAGRIVTWLLARLRGGPYPQPFDVTAPAGRAAAGRP